MHSKKHFKLNQQRNNQQGINITKMLKGNKRLTQFNFDFFLFNPTFLPFQSITSFSPLYFSNAMSTITGGVSPVISQTSIAIISGATNTNMR